jgi:hypothetical protein
MKLFMGLIGNLWQSILSYGIPPIYAADNPRIYLFALGAIVLTLVLTFVRLIQTRKASTLLGLVFGLPVIELAWLAYSTPVDRLFGFAPGVVTTVAAGAIHGLLALMPLALVGIWLAQLGLKAASLWSIGSELVACGLIVVGIETQAWPANLVVVLEGALTFVVFASIGIAVLRVESRTGKAPRWAGVLYFGLWSAALLLILFAHPVQSQLVALCTLFLAIIWIDGLAGNNRWRFLITVPVVLAAGALGAANVFAPLTHGAGLTFRVWIEATVAGAIFLFVAPLVDWAQSAIMTNVAHREAQVRAERDSVAKIDQNVKQQLEHRGVFQWLGDKLSGAEDVTKAELAQLHAQERAHEQQLARLKSLAERLNQELDHYTAALFFGIVLAYYVLVHFAANLPDPVPLLRPIAGATLITIVGIVLNQAISRSVATARKLGAETGENDVFRHAAFDPARTVVAVFLNAILIIYGLGGNLGIVITQGACSDLSNTSCILFDLPNGASHTGGIAPLALLTNGSFWIVAARIAAGIALVVLALGQWRFVSVVNKVRKATQTASQAGEGRGAPAQTPERTPLAAPAAVTHGS